MRESILGNDKIFIEHAYFSLPRFFANVLSDASNATRGGAFNVLREGMTAFAQGLISRLCPSRLSINNGLESTNGGIKKRNTLMMRLSHAMFLKQSLNLLMPWSKRRHPDQSNFRQFASKPTISATNYTHAC